MRANDTKGMKGAIINWITPKGQTLNPHIPRNAKVCWGFHHKWTGALLCPAGYDWANVEYVLFQSIWHVCAIFCYRIKEKLHKGQLQVLGNQWPMLLYASYTYDPDDPWNSLLHSGILILVSHCSWHLWLLMPTHSQAYKHIFTSPSSIDFKELKATHSCNARIYGMHSIMKASIAYVAMQVSHRFYLPPLLNGQLFNRLVLLWHWPKFSLTPILQQIRNVFMVLFSNSLRTLMRKTRLNSFWHGGTGDQLNSRWCTLTIPTGKFSHPVLKVLQFLSFTMSSSSSR